MIIEVEIKKSIVDRAEKKSKEMGRLRNSITKGSGNIAGFIGEEIVKEYISADESNTYDYDLVKGNFKIDVKTKRTNYPPLSYYEASIANYNPNQKCDIYAFVRVLNDFSKAYLCGWVTKEQYFKKAKFLKKGQVDPSNNFTVKADCYNLPYSCMNPFKKNKRG